jgi:hypothetical protein
MMLLEYIDDEPAFEAEAYAEWTTFALPARRL